MVEPLPAIEQSRQGAGGVDREAPPALRQLETREPWTVIHSRELRELIDRTRSNLGSWSPVFVDVDSQLDFLYPAGALYVPRGRADRARHHAPQPLRRRAPASRLISTVDAHAENDPEFKIWPHHCIAGTWGQRKAEATLIDRRILTSESCLSR